MPEIRSVIGQASKQRPVNRAKSVHGQADFALPNYLVKQQLVQT
jgi:hypothetical protein